jgi:hypothetical protein
MFCPGFFCRQQLCSHLTASALAKCCVNRFTFLSLSADSQHALPHDSTRLLHYLFLYLACISWLKRSSTRWSHSYGHPSGASG